MPSFYISILLFQLKNKTLEFSEHMPSELQSLFYTYFKFFLLYFLDPMQLPHPHIHRFHSAAAVWADAVS